MKKTLKAFTLIELIIVMAIMSILMLAIMQMMKPIRSTYVDSTLYESQRTTQSGMVRYLTEKVRYATNLGIYNETESGITCATDAITKFKNKTKKADGTMIPDDQIYVITIDNTTNYTYANKTYKGRIICSKKLAAGGSYNNTVGSAGATDQGRLALGDAYYGTSNYSIDIKDDGKNLSISVASLVVNSLGEKETARNVDIEDIKSSTKFVQTVGYVACQNLAISGGIYDNTYKGSTTTTDGKNVYIVFTLPKD